MNWSPTLLHSLEFTTGSFVFSAPLHATVVLTQREIPSQLNGILCVSTYSRHAGVVLPPSSSGSAVGEQLWVGECGHHTENSQYELYSTSCHSQELSATTSRTGNSENC